MFSVEKMHTLKNNPDLHLYQILKETFDVTYVYKIKLYKDPSRFSPKTFLPSLRYHQLMSKTLVRDKDDDEDFYLCTESIFHSETNWLSMSVKSNRLIRTSKELA